MRRVLADQQHPLDRAELVEGRAGRSLQAVEIHARCYGLALRVGRVPLDSVATSQLVRGDPKWLCAAPLG